MKIQQRILPVLLLFLLALLPRVLFLLLVPYTGPSGDEIDYDRVGWSIAQGKGFADESGNPTSFIFPLYPYYLAIHYKAFGHAYLPVFLSQCVISALLCAMLYAFARGAFGARAALVSFIFSAVYPPFVFYTAQLLGELLLAVLFFAFFMCLRAALVKKSMALSVLCGFLLGLCALIRGESLFFLPVFFIYSLFAKKEFRLPLTHIFALTFVFALSMLPWTARNMRVHKAFVPLSTRGGATLYNSFFIPEEGFSYSGFKNAGAGFLKLKTEVEKDRYLMKKATDYILHHPAKVIALIPVKLGHLFYPFDGEWYSVSMLSKYNLMFGLVMTFSFFGFLMLRKEPGGTFYWLPVITLILVASIFYGKPRFRLFIEPYMIIMASYCIARWSGEKPASKTFFAKFFPVIAANLLLFLFADNITSLLRQILNAALRFYPKA